MVFSAIASIWAYNSIIAGFVVFAAGLAIAGPRLAPRPRTPGAARGARFSRPARRRPASAPGGWYGRAVAVVRVEELVKRYPKAQARDYDSNPGRITEADALIAYLQVLGTLVDFKLYDDKANIR